MRTHEELLTNAIKELQKQGFRVIRLDRRIIPDAVAIKGEEVVAIEADTSPVSVWMTTRKLENGSQYDSEIIVTNPYSERYYTREQYSEAMKLRGEGRSYREISRLLREKHGRRFPISLVHDWAKHRKKPFGI